MKRWLDWLLNRPVRVGVESGWYCTRLLQEQKERELPWLTDYARRT